MDKPYLTDPWFFVCLRESLDSRDLLANYDRLYGATLSTAPTKEGMAGFVEFVYDFVYTRIDRPAEYPVPSWLRQDAAEIIARAKREAENAQHLPEGIVHG